jgi:hypothetical protein
MPKRHPWSSIVSPMTTLIATTVVLQHIFPRFLERGHRKFAHTVVRKEIPRPKPPESRLSSPCSIIIPVPMIPESQVKTLVNESKLGLETYGIFMAIREVQNQQFLTQAVIFAR